MKDIEFSMRALEGKAAASARSASMAIQLQRSEESDTLVKLHHELVNERDALHLKLLHTKPPGFLAEDYAVWDEAMEASAPGIAHPSIIPMSDLFQHGLPENTAWRLAEDWFRGTPFQPRTSLACLTKPHLPLSRTDWQASRTTPSYLQNYLSTRV